MRQEHAGMNGLKTVKSNIIAQFLRPKLIVLLATLFLTGLARAQQVKFTTIASSREVGRNDYVQIEFVVENAQQIEHLVQPSFPDFRVVQGPIQSSGMSIVNGNMTQYKALSFVLQPVKTGRFTIPGATATVDGKPMRSNPVTIEVSSGSAPSPGNRPSMPQPAWPDEPPTVDREYILKPGESAADKIRRNLFVKVQVSKTSCYVGEPIVATYKLYSRLRSESRVTRHPSLNGFSVYDMIDPGTDASSVETVNGKPFTVHTIRKAQLIPLQPGTINLDGVEVENTVHFIKTGEKGQRRHSNNVLQDLFDQLADDNMDGTPVDQHVTLDSKPVAISVKALPEADKPSDFNGAVGHFNIQSSIENKNLTAEDAAVLKLTVKGSGNLPVVNAPAVSWPSGIENYDASVKEDIDKTTAPLSGTKTFEYAFIPKQKGKYNIPAVSFSYFDPASASYKTVQSQPVDLSVTAAKTKKHASPAILSAAPAKDTGGSIREFLQQHLEWFFAILILSGLAVYLWMQNLRLKKAGVPAAKPAVTASPEIREPETKPEPPDPLRQSRQLLNNGDYRTFYTELNRALWNEVTGRLNLPGSEMNKHHIGLKLAAKGWAPETIGMLENIFSECEMKLYTPNYSVTDVQRILQDAELVIAKLNNA